MRERRALVLAVLSNDISVVSNHHLINIKIEGGSETIESDDRDRCVPTGCVPDGLHVRVISLENGRYDDEVVQLCEILKKKGRSPIFSTLGKLAPRITLSCAKEEWAGPCFLETHDIGSHCCSSSDQFTDLRRSASVAPFQKEGK